MTASGPNPQESFIRKTTRTLYTACDNMLRGYPEVGSIVEGFSGTEFLGYVDRRPINIEKILGDDFKSKVHPSFFFALQALKDDDEIDKKKIHATLLHKYCGIDVGRGAFHSLSIGLPSEVNAYLACPSEEASDYFLHLYFLQPFQLYGIKDHNRKHQGDDRTVCLREWYWDQTGCDSAPLFRKIFQVFILSEILQDYVENNSDFHDPRVAAMQNQLSVLRTQLCEIISVDLIALREALIQAQSLGAVDGNAAPSLRRTEFVEEINDSLPGIEEVASLYPLGRLFLAGQSRQEAHHLIAQKQGASSWLSYIGHWLFAHLNFSTSVFWIDVLVKNYQTIWRQLKNYVSRSEHDFSELLSGGPIIVSNIFILVSAPLLIIFPWIHGMTSIPFTLIRSLCLYGPFPMLKRFWILKCLDGIELIKDAFFSLMYVKLFLFSMFAIIYSLSSFEFLVNVARFSFLLGTSLVVEISLMWFFPSHVLRIYQILHHRLGESSSLAVLGLLMTALSLLRVELPLFISIYLLTAEALVHLILIPVQFFTLIVPAIIISIPLFLVMGIMARQAAFFLPETIGNQLRVGVSLIERLGERVKGYFQRIKNYFFPFDLDTVDVGIIPRAIAEPAINFSVASTQQILLQCLRNALNLSQEEKDKLKRQEHLERDYLFTPEEAHQLRELMDVGNTVFQKDRQMTSAFELLPRNNIYIPSQDALIALRDSGQLHTLPEATRNKCNRILAMT